MQWLYLDIFGNGFELFHLMCLIGYCVICNQILYKVPMKFNRFKTPEEVEKEGEKKDISKIEVSKISEVAASP